MYNKNMILMSKKYKKFVENFINFCKKNEIWFSIDSLCLLTFMSKESFDEIEDHFEVFIDLKSFNKLKDISLRNIVDSSIDNSFPNLTAIWVENNQTWIGEDMAIKIRVAIPTTEKKIHRFNSIFRRIINKIKHHPDNIKVAIDELTEFGEFNGYFLLDSRNNTINSTNWIQSLSFKRHWVTSNGLTFPVIYEYKTIIKKWYGDEIKVRNIDES